MNLICFGQMNWDWCWTGKQHLMSRLSRRGHSVLYIDPSWQKESPGGKKFIPASFQGLRELDHNLFTYTYPFNPLLGWRGNKAIYPRVLHRLVQKLNFTDSIVLTMLPHTARLVQAVNPTAYVYYAIDEMTAFGGKTVKDQPQVRIQEEKLVAASQAAFAVSERLVSRLRRVQPRTYLLPNAVDTDHYSPARLERLPLHSRLSRLTGPVIGFMGQIDERMDQEIVLHMSQARPGWNLVLAGRVKPGFDASRLAQRENIFLTGYQPYEELPGILKHFNVCTVPYKINELTRACSPIKVYEYLATGRPVVSTPLEGALPLRDAISLADGPDKFLRAVEDSLTQDTMAAKENRLGVARTNNWERRTDELEHRLEETLVRARKRPAHVLVFPAFSSVRRRQSALVHANRQSRLKQIIPFRTFIAAGKVYYGLRLAGRVLSNRRPLKIRKILVTRRGLLGDMVVYLPALSELRRQFPRARIVLGLESGANVQDLFKHNLPVDEIRQMDFFSLRSWKKIPAAIKLFSEGFDLVLTGATYFFKKEAFFTGAPFRAGLFDGQPLQRLNNRLLPLDLTRHESENNLELVSTLSGRNSAPMFVPLFLDEQVIRKKGEEIREKLEIPDQARIAIIHPGAQKESRRWPASQAAQLTRMIVESSPENIVVFTGIKKELELVESIQHQLCPDILRKTRSAAGETDILSFVGLLDHCQVFISNDTGVMHLARTRGTPLVAILGPENDYRWGPARYGPGPAVSLRHQVPCAPCVRRDCPEHYCMKLMTPETVFQQVKKFLPRKKEPARPGKVFRLKHHVEDYSWEQLQARGFNLPLVSIFACMENGSMPESLLRTALNQNYPNLEIILAGTKAVLDRIIQPGLKKVIINNPPADTSDFLREDFSSCRGEFVALLTPQSKWHSSKISDDVAALIRNPEAGTAASSAFSNSSTFYRQPRDSRLGRVTLRRSFLEKTLAGKKPLTKVLQKTSPVLQFQLMIR